MKSADYYYNTTNETGNNLKEYTEDAKNQEIKILAFFKKNPNKLMAPHEIHKMVFGESNVPITSVRRAMTNLSSRGCIEKTSIKTIGSYGKPVYTWVLPEEND